MRSLKFQSYYILVLVTLLMMSCKDKITDNELVGTWELEEYERVIYVTNSKDKITDKEVEIIPWNNDSTINFGGLSSSTYRSMTFSLESFTHFLPKAALIYGTSEFNYELMHRYSKANSACGEDFADKQLVKFEGIDNFIIFSDGTNYFLAKIEDDRLKLWYKDYTYPLVEAGFYADILVFKKI